MYEILYCDKLDEVKFGPYRSLTSNTYKARTSFSSVTEDRTYRYRVRLVYVSTSNLLFLTKRGGGINDLSSVNAPTNSVRVVI